MIFRLNPLFSPIKYLFFGILACHPASAMARRAPAHEETVFVLKAADALAPVGRILKRGSAGGELYRDGLPPRSKVPLSDYAEHPAGGGGFVKIIPGLSLSTALERSSIYGEHWEYDGGTARNKNTFGGGAWPDTPEPQNYGYSAQYHSYVLYELRREAGPLEPGDHTIKIGRIVSPTRGSWEYSVKIHVPGATCAVNSKHKEVKLIPASIADINALPVGGKTKAAGSFDLVVDCNAVKTLTVTFHNAQGDDSRPHFEPSPASTAVGVGVALERAGTAGVILPGQAINIPFDGSSTRISSKFTASYVKVSPTVKAGTVSATANFTIDYE